jgi:integrase
MQSKLVKNYAASLVKATPTAGATRKNNGIFYPYLYHKKGENWKGANPEYLGVSFNTEKQAVNYANNALVQRLASGAPTTAADISFSDWLNKWLSERTEDGELTFNTLTYYGCAVKQIETYFADKPLAELSREDLRAYFLEKGQTLANATLKSHRKVLNQALDLAVETRLIEYNPLPKKTPKSKIETAEKQPPSMELMRKILLAVREYPLYPLMLFTASLGLRAEEVTALQWASINSEKSTVKIWQTLTRQANGITLTNSTKSASSERELPLSAELTELLQDVQSEQERSRALLGNKYKQAEYIFTRANGSHYTPESFGRTLAWAISKLAKLPEFETDTEFQALHITPHILRHFFITQISRLASPYVLKALAGHSKKDVTEGYVHSTLDDCRTAVSKLTKSLRIDLESETHQ